MLPDFKRAKQLLEIQQQRFTRHAVNMYMPGHLHQASIKTIYEGETVVVEMARGERIERDVAKVQSRSETYSLEQLKENPELIYIQLLEVAKSLGNEMGINSVNTMMDFAIQNNTNTNQPAEDVVEMIFRMWERLDWVFDDNGKHNEHTFIVNPASSKTVESGLKRIESEPSLIERKKELVEKKRKLWNDRKNNRELAG